jgi:hypothetical protein
MLKGCRMDAIALLENLGVKQLAWGRLKTQSLQTGQVIIKKHNYNIKLL